MGRGLRLLLTFLTGAAIAVAAFGAEDDDSPRPVVVKPKRSSIEARSLAHLIEIAEERSPNILKAKSTFDVVRLNYEVTRRQWLPSFDISTVHGPTNDYPTNIRGETTPWQSDVDLTMTENFYDNGVSLTQYEISKSAFERGRIEYEVARDNQLLAIGNAFYDWSDAVEQREILENKRDLLQRQFNVLQTLYKQGIKTKRDVLRIETEIRRNDLAVISGDNDVDLDFQKIASATGISRQELEKEDIETEKAKASIKPEVDLTPLSLKEHRQSKINAFLEREAGLSTQLARRNYLPQVYLNGEVGWHNQQYLYEPGADWDTNRNWDWSALLTVKYNIWDWGIRDRQLEIAKVAERQRGEQDGQTLLDLSNDLRNVMLQLKSFRESVKMSQELLVLEQQAYNILDAEYRDGRSTYLDLITNLNTLIDARSRFIDSYFGLKKQQILYAFHKGDLYERIKQK